MRGQLGQDRLQKSKIKSRDHPKTAVVFVAAFFRDRDIKKRRRFENHIEHGRTQSNIDNNDTLSDDRYRHGEGCY
ncbi:hypothetical protein LCGC14_1679040 [marine sediment metagenome]|uniref:Uncharacterized protein n=1 Tax=marine sediment metagenome TaxID=412755 RepID=A0A0F9IBL3_9ZZZZ